MRRFNFWAALITGVPLAALVAHLEGTRTQGCSPLLSGILAALVIGLPQGLLAAVPLFHRRWWHRAALLAAMVVAGFVSTIGTLVILSALSSMTTVPTEVWQPVEGPPVRITALVGPICTATSLPYYAVTTEDGQNFQSYVREGTAWTAIDSIPAGNCRSQRGSATQPVPGVEVSRVVFRMRDYEEQMALAADGSLWRLERIYEAGSWEGRDRESLVIIPLIVGTVLLSPVPSLVAWVVVIRKTRRPNDLPN